MKEDKNNKDCGWSAIKIDKTGTERAIHSDNELPSTEKTFDIKQNMWSKLNPFKRKQKFIPDNLYTDGKSVVVCKSDRYFGMQMEHIGYFTGIKLIGEFKDEIFRCEDGYLKSDFKPISEEDLIMSGKYYQVGSRYENKWSGDIVEVVKIMPDMTKNIKCKILSSRNKQSIGCTEYFSGGLNLMGYVINKQPAKIAEPFSFNEIFMSQKLGIIVTPTNGSGILTDKFNAVVIHVFDKDSKYKVDQFIPQIDKKDFVYMTQKEFNIIKKYKKCVIA